MPKPSITEEKRGGDDMAMLQWQIYSICRILETRGVKMQ